MKQRFYQNDRLAGFRSILFLVALLLVWATVLGAGVILNSKKGEILKPAIILGTAGLFCVVWFAAFALRKRPHNPAGRSAHKQSASNENGS